MANGDAVGRPTLWDLLNEQKNLWELNFRGLNEKMLKMDRDLVLLGERYQQSLRYETRMDELERRVGAQELVAQDLQARTPDRPELERIRESTKYTLRQRDADEDTSAALRNALWAAVFGGGAVGFFTLALPAILHALGH